jgi:hypothetical protein
MQLRWNGYFFLEGGGRGNTGQRSRRKSLDVQERTKHSPFSTGRICSRAVALSFVSIAYHASKSDADQEFASGERALDEFSSLSSNNTLTLISDKAYVRCSISEGFSRPVHCSSFNSVMREKLPCSLVILSLTYSYFPKVIIYSIIIIIC